MRQSWVREMGHYALPHWRGLSIILLLMFGNIGLQALQPWPLKLIVDKLLVQQPLNIHETWLAILPYSHSRMIVLGWLAAATVLLFWSIQLITIAQEHLKIGVGERLSYTLGNRVFEHLQQLSLVFHSQHPTGDLIRRVTTDITCIRQLILDVGLSIVSSLTTLIVIFWVMWQMDFSLAILAIAFAPPLALLIRVFDLPMTQQTYRHQQLEGKMISLAEQTLSALPVVQAFSREKIENRRYHHLSRRTLRAYLKSMIAQMQFKVGVNTITMAGRITIMMVGGFHVLAGKLTVGSLLVFQTYLTALYSPIETLAYLSMGYATAKAKAQRVMEILAIDHQITNEPGSNPIIHGGNSVRGHVRLEGIRFGYLPEHPILKGITLEAQPSETIALVGTTGAGKSTLVSLIPRLFDPWEGRVTIDGKDIRRVTLESLRSQISLVLQDPFLLPMTIAENIAYGRPRASRAEIIAAAVAANADEFVQQLPQGYDTVIGDRGAKLSGGQKQRLSVARALLKDAPILILDEPTAALDMQTEALQMQAIEQLMQGRTTFIVAHRLSTIRRADRIIVLSNGKVLEEGSHQELIRAQGYYNHLYSISQASSSP